MPNHVHLFLELGKRGLKATIEHWKRWTSRQCLPLLGVAKERFWQREWFDHWSRSDQEDDRITGYIRNNPEKAGLVTDYRDWPYGMWSL
jgi:putative transposase